MRGLRGCGCWLRRRAPAARLQWLCSGSTGPAGWPPSARSCRWPASHDWPGMIGRPQRRQVWPIALGARAWRADWSARPPRRLVMIGIPVGRRGWRWCRVGIGSRPCRWRGCRGVEAVEVGRAERVPGARSSGGRRARQRSGRHACPARPGAPGDGGQPRSIALIGLTVVVAVIVDVLACVTTYSIALAG